MTEDATGSSRNRVVVTGAASGIGRATTLRLAAAGTPVLGVDLDADGLAATVADGSGNVTPLLVDVTDPEAVAGVAAEVGDAALAGLVNVVGGARLREVAEMDLAWWESELRFNLTTTFMLCNALLPALRRGPGAIVNLSSGWGFRAAPGRAAYAAAKAGIVGFSRSLAAEVAADGIRVNVVAPGAVRTERMVALSRGDELASNAHAAIPLARLGEPPEVAAAICHLLSDDASYVTGTTVHVNGGLFMP